MYRLITYLLSILIGLQIHAQCDPAKRPIIFIHGFLASGDSYAGQVQRFIDAGYCPDRLFVFDWNTVNGNAKKTDSLLNALIDEVLKKTNAAKVDLVGHSAGGGLGRSYLADSVHATKIAHYVHIGSRKWNKEYAWFPNGKCLNVWSPADKVMGSGGGDVNGAINLSLKDKDHYEVATCYATWSAMYQFFNDLEVVESVPPPMVTVPADGGYSIGGKAVLLGDNTPMRGAAVHVWSVKSVNGKRNSKEPIASFTVSDDGKWGPVKTKQNEYYELELIPAEKNQRTISYYIGRVDNDDHFIYLRGFPQGNMVSMMLGSLPAKEDQSVIVIYSAIKAMIAGRDSVTVNGIAVSSDVLTPAAKTIISSFILDDGDHKTSGTALKQYGNAPFIGGVDISLPVSNKAVHSVYFNGKTLNLPAVASKERILLAVFK